jgi:hypothetical protein
VDKLPDLAFDHIEAVKMALNPPYALGVFTK